jgi:hypothetical protein
VKQLIILAILLQLPESILSQTKEADTPPLKEAIKWIVNFSNLHGRAMQGDSTSIERLNYFAEVDGCSMSFEVQTVDLVTGIVIGKETDPLSLADLAPERVKVRDDTTVYFEVSDLSKKIKGAVTSIDGKKTDVLLADGTLYLDSKESAEEFAAAFRNAIKLCGGAPSRS